MIHAENSFTGKIAIVTGGAKGIGKNIAETFALHGAQVAILDKDETAGIQTVASLPGNGHLFITADATRREDLEMFASRVLEEYGAVDYLVNNACVSHGGLESRCSYDDFLDVLKVGVAAPYLLTLLFRDAFNPGGAIVNISSTRSVMSQADTESYTAAKGGISALTHGMAMSLASRGIRVNGISPGWIDTGAFGPLSHIDHKQHPAGRAGTPDDISSLVLFLCSPQASFITGENVTADGGMSRRMIYHGDEGWTYTPA